MELCRVATLVLSLAVIGCGVDTAADVGADAGAFVDAGPDETEAMFDPTHVLDIEIEMADADWDTLRLQSRDVYEVLGGNCLKEPPPSPFTYLPATVTIDGQRVEQVGIRKKGFFGSLSDTKPSLKIKFAKYVPKQRFSGLKRMTLNNNKSDSSHVNQCLGYNLFAKAGVPAPRCSFATVSVNGNKLGIFTHIESIKKPFVKRHFADKSGNLYEGALSDFRPGWVDTFQRKTNKADPDLGEVDDRSDLQALVDALVVPDSELLDTLEALVDMDSFLNFWVMEVIMMHADGYGRNTNNFYIYNDPGDGKFHFLPWGIDSILFQNLVLPWEDALPPESIFAEGALARRLYRHPEFQAMYLQRMQELLGSVWDEDALVAEIDRMEELLTPHLLPDTEFAQGMRRVRRFVAGRREDLQVELEVETPLAWSKQLRDPWCLESLGTINATFAGQWTENLDGSDAFGDGTLSLSSTLATLSLTDASGGTTFGVDVASSKRILRLVSWVQVAADPQVDTSVALLVLIEINDEDVAPQTIVLGFPSHPVSVARLVFPPNDAPAEFELVGLLPEGTLQLDSIAIGGAVSGRLQATVYESLF